MASVTEVLQKFLSSPAVLCSDKNAMLLYAIAYNLGWAKEVKDAASYLLYTPPQSRPYVAELEEVPAATRRLTQHWKCFIARAMVTRLDFTWIGQREASWIACKNCGEKKIRLQEGEKRKRPAAWWLDYMDKVEKALSDRPTGASITRDQTVDRALGAASECKRCRAKVFEGMRTFTRRYAQLVEDKVAQVELSMAAYE